MAIRLIICYNLYKNLHITKGKPAGHLLHYISDLAISSHWEQELSLFFTKSINAKSFLGRFDQSTIVKTRR